MDTFKQIGTETYDYLGQNGIGTSNKWHLGKKMIAINSLPLQKWPPFRQPVFSIAFSSMKMMEFRFKFHCNKFPGVQLTIS